MRNIKRSEFTVAQRPGKFASIDAIGLECSFFMDGGDICRIDHDTINTERFQLIVDPEAAITCFVGTVTSSSWEMVV